MDRDIQFLTIAANALAEAADELKRDNDRADMPKAKFCLEQGCPCKDNCPEGCYLLECNGGKE